MKIDLVAVGKTVDKNFIASIKEYVNRLLHYVQFSFIENIVLVLPNIEMNPPQVYMCSPS